MKVSRKNRGKLAVYAAATLGVSAVALSATFVPAIAARSDSSVSASAGLFFEQFTPAGVDARLAEKFEARSKAVDNGSFPFTVTRDQQRARTLTVAARSLAPRNTNAISVRNSIAALETGNGAGRLRSTEFRLTSAKGWQGFNLGTDTRSAVKAPLIADLGKSSFRLDKGPKEKPSRFQPDIAVAKNNSVAPAARGNAAPDDYQLDVGGSFSISRKVDVTAGVRYKSERDRIAPNVDQQDSEAVYVGTKIRF